MSILTWTLFTPGQDELERGARWVRCDVVARSGNKLVRAAGRHPAARARACPTTAARLPDRHRRRRLVRAAARLQGARPSSSRTPAKGQRGLPRRADLHRHRPGPVPAAAPAPRRLLAAAEPGRVERRGPLHPLPGPGAASRPPLASDSVHAGDDGPMEQGITVDIDAPARAGVGRAHRHRPLVGVDRLGHQRAATRRGPAACSVRAPSWRSRGSRRASGP